MRAALLGLIAVAGLALTAPSASAVPLASAKATAGAPAAIEKVAEGCGPGRHWVGGYRNRYGNWVRGHCVHN